MLLIINIQHLSLPVFPFQCLASGSWDIGALQLNSPLQPNWLQTVLMKLLQFMYCSVFVSASSGGTQSLLTSGVALLYSRRWPPLRRGCYEAKLFLLLDLQTTLTAAALSLPVGRSDPQQKGETGKANLRNPPTHSPHRHPLCWPAWCGRTLRTTPTSSVLLNHPALHEYMEGLLTGRPWVLCWVPQWIKCSSFFSRNTQFSGVASEIQERSLWKQPRRLSSQRGGRKGPLDAGLT